MKGSFLKCSGCSTGAAIGSMAVFDDVDGLWAHITMVHVVWIPFECILCPLTLLPTERALKEHYQRTHPGMIPRAIYTYEEEKKQALTRILVESQQLSDSPTTTVRNITKNENVTRSDYTSTPIQTDLNVRPGNEMNFESLGYTFNDPTKLLFDKAETSPIDGGIIIGENELFQDTLPVKEDRIKRARLPKKLASGKHRDRKRSRTKRPSKCNLCQAIVADTSNKTRHVWYHHLSRDRFSCRECRFETPRLDTIKQHCRVKHDLIYGVWWTDRKEELQAHYYEQFEAAFGQKGEEISVDKNDASVSNWDALQETVKGRKRRTLPTEKKESHIFEKRKKRSWEGLKQLTDCNVGKQHMDTTEYLTIISEE